MSRRRLHLIAPAGSCRPFLQTLELRHATELVAIVQSAVGDGYNVTADAEILEGQEDETQGGRIDDQRRADDISSALADDEVAAIITLRGGAWFNRILPLIDFSVLDQRRSRIAVVGFSELTSLVNIVGAHPHGVGIYDMGPTFLTYGLRHFAAKQQQRDGEHDHQAAEKYASEHLLAEFRTFFKDAVAMIEGHGSKRRVSAELIRGELGDQTEGVVVGGNLTLLSAMVGSRFHECIAPAGRWVLVEDFNDRLERFDRLLSHLTIAGYWEQCAGILLGDFHRGWNDFFPAMKEMLAYHIPSASRLPVLYADMLGHTWPMSPLPLHLPLRFERAASGRYDITWPNEAVQTV